MFTGDDPSPWKLLYGGQIDRIERAGDEVTMRLRRTIVRQQFADPGSAFRVRLAGCTRFEHVLDGIALDEPGTTELETIARRGPVVVDASHARDRIAVRCRHGVLYTSYASLALELDSGRVLDGAELRAVVAPLWAQWWRDTPIQHPAICDGSLAALLAAWRTERTALLAALIATFPHEPIDALVRDVHAARSLPARRRRARCARDRAVDPPVGV